jgi:dihydrolipoamide dehydrogenase
MAAPSRVVVRVPAIGDFADVEVVEVLVAPGDRVEAEASLVTLESDKASMEIPSPHAGVVVELRVSEGDRVSEGSELLVLELPPASRAAGAARSEAAGRAESKDGGPPLHSPARSEAAGRAESKDGGPSLHSPPRPAPRSSSAPDRLTADVVVLGGGPGGYTAAFRAADLGKRVVLVERYPVLGGVCLNVGCIPSKALLHVAEVIREAADLAEAGVRFGPPELDLERLRARKDGVVRKLTDGLGQLARRRKVELRVGSGRFEAANRIRIDGAGAATVEFEHAIVAVGSRSVGLPGLPDDPRVMDSTSALALEEIPERLLVIGGGVIGLEMATLYAALGARVSVVELLPELLSGIDRDLVRPLRRRLEGQCEAIWQGTRVLEVTGGPSGLRARLEGPGAPPEAGFDRVLVAVGRTGRGAGIGAEHVGLRVDARGFIPADARQRSNVPHVFAIGDVTGPPLLAHRAMHQGKVAAEVIAGLPAAYDPRAVPSVAYTDPEVAWAGLSSGDAEARGIAVRTAVIPWSANGRALGLGRGEGLTKLLFSQETGRLVGAGMVGARAGDLIAEAVVAIELGADAEDVALAIHPHPTLSETVALAAELAAGTITDLAPAARAAAAPRSAGR